MFIGALLLSKEPQWHSVDCRHDNKMVHTQVIQVIWSGLEQLQALYYLQASDVVHQLHALPST